MGLWQRLSASSRPCGVGRMWQGEHSLSSLGICDLFPASVSEVCVRDYHCGAENCSFSSSLPPLSSLTSQFLGWFKSLLMWEKV